MTLFSKHIKNTILGSLLLIITGAVWNFEYTSIFMQVELAFINNMIRLIKYLASFFLKDILFIPPKVIKMKRKKKIKTGNDKICVFF